MTRLLSAALCLFAMLVCSAGAQEKNQSKDKAPAAKAQADKAPESGDSAKSEAGEDKPAEKSAADPAVAEFQQTFADWKELLAKMEDLRNEYIATPRGPKRAPLKKQFEELVAQAEEMEPKVVAAAQAAFAAVGDKAGEAGKFLAAMLKYDVEHDNYEPAVGIARTLIEHDYDNPRVYNYGGLAAFFTNDFKDAEKWLKAGDDQSVLEVDAKQYLSKIRQYESLWDAEKELRDADADADLPRVLLKTTKGDIVVELFENEAPNSVANFISLVEKGFYNGLKFHRVLEHFMAQGGDPNGDGSGGPGYTIPDEIDRSDYRSHFRGSLSMAKTQAPNSGGSQFFLMFRPSGPAAGFNLNGAHTVFGRVIDGMDVLARIQRIDPDSPKPGVKPDKIVEATVLRKRKHDYVPKKSGEEPEAETKSE